MNKLLTLLLLCCSLLATGQERKPLSGRIISGGSAAAGVFVINNATGTEVKSGADGSFAIPAKTGDKLAVYSDKIDVREFAVSDASFKSQPYVLEVNYKAIELDEVVVAKQDINPEALGLVPKGQKQYTPAERRLKQAKSGMGIDQLINVLSGRMKMLKKALETERKEALVDALNGLFTDDELEGLGVPKDMAQGFIFYAVEDDRIVRAIKDQNEALIKLLLMELSDKYTKLQEGNE